MTERVSPRWGVYPIQKRRVCRKNGYPSRAKHIMSKAETGSRSLQVLHLEDDLLDAELIRAELEEHHIPCSVTLIASAREFTVTLRERHVDLILSDSSVPGFDTLSALKITREHHPEVPFVFISDNSSPRIRA